MGLVIAGLEPKQQFFNPSQENWDTDPYMVKPYSVRSECGKYLATVVVVAGTKEKVIKKGAEKGQTKEQTTFYPMGVRIEKLREREVEGRFVIPGGSYFVKKSTNSISHTPRCYIQRDRCGKVQHTGFYPNVVKPGKQKTDAGEPFAGKWEKMFGTLVKLAWEAHEAHRAEMMAARKAA